MTYTPEQIAAHIAQRAAAVGENSADVRILRQLVADMERVREAWGPLERACRYADELNKRNPNAQCLPQDVILSSEIRDAAACLSTQEGQL